MGATNGINNKSSQPLVSVITPSYNASNYIKEAIDSVRQQTYENWEMLIVDDCSTDDSQRIIKNEAAKDERIRFIPLKENRGAAFARNTAISNARGKYIAFLDSDDLWMPEKLDKQIQFMRNENIAFSFTRYSVVDQAGKEMNKTVGIPDEIDYKGLLKNTVIGCLTVIIDIEKTGPVQMPDIRTRQDFALWLSILKKGHNAYGLQETLAKYRVVEGSISSNKLKVAKRNWEVYRKIEKLSFIYSVWCFLNYVYHASIKRI